MKGTSTLKNSEFSGSITKGYGLITNSYVESAEEVLDNQIYKCKVTSNIEEGAGLGYEILRTTVDLCEFIGDITVEGDGLFRRAGLSTISECEVEGIIHGSGICGVIVDGDTLIQDCEVRGSFIGPETNNYLRVVQTAGLVGMVGIETYIDGENCIQRCKVFGDVEYGAGLAKNLGGTMRRCLFIGEIINTQARYNPSSSGLLGLVNDTGKLHESGFFGTIIDETEDPDTLLVGAVKEAVGEIKNVLVRGQIKSPKGKVSGLFGMVYMLDNFENAYFEGTLEGNETFGAVQRIDGPPNQTTDSIYYSADAEDLYAMKKTIEELKEETTFPTWDFEKTWIILASQNDNLPILRWMVGQEGPPKPRPQRVQRTSAQVLSGSTDKSGLS